MMLMYWAFCYLSMLLATPCVEFKTIFHLFCQIKYSNTLAFSFVFVFLSTLSQRWKKLIAEVQGCFSASLCWCSSTSAVRYVAVFKHAIEHLTMGEDLTCDWFSFVSFTLAFHLFYSSLCNVAAAMPGWKINTKNTQSVRQGIVLSQ